MLLYLLSCNQHIDISVNKQRSRAAEYGERWEHRSQEILAEKGPARKFECKNRSVRKFGGKIQEVKKHIQ